MFVLRKIPTDYDNDLTIRYEVGERSFFYLYIEQYTIT